ncbi:hypothetical protein [Psychroserpens sp. SPM9]|uniref:hypothetical protein n=1 Tax=Psychroserpens sp. SPM9 TaxID=2975598 RepID=UPI0021A2EED1|nr:hypothetical protein [Psychroserpens sp. SPM9]MDG5491192.1 hypothetical protein [Psychroserpens sp. SPM9]
MRAFQSLVFMILFACICQKVYTQKQVGIHTNKIGAGILRSYNSENYIIAPKLLFEDTQVDAKVFGINDFETNAIRVSGYYNKELVILKLPSKKSNIVSDPWDNDKIIDYTNGFTFKANLSIIQKNKSRLQIPVSIKNIGEKYITIIPKSDSLFSTEMIGAAIKFDNEIIGMVINIDSDGTIGEFIKISALHEITNSFFDKSTVEERKNENIKKALGFNNYGSLSYKDRDLFLFSIDKNRFKSFDDLFTDDIKKLKQLNFGENKNYLNRTIDLKAILNDTVYNKNQVHIPKRVGSTSMYYQYQFENNERSKIYEVKNISNQPNIEGIGYSLKPINIKKGELPSIFISPNPLKILPETPAYTTHVSYAYDSDEYEKINPLTNYKTGVYSIFEIPVITTSKKISLKFTLLSGEVLGPYEYEFKSWETLQKLTNKLKLKTKIDSKSFECYKVGERPVKKSTDDKKESNRIYEKQKSWDALFSKKKLAFAKGVKFPAIVCKCKYNNTSDELWSPIKQIKSGTESGNLNDTYLSQKIEESKYVRYLKKSYLKTSYLIWENVFPATAASIFLKVVYYDNDESYEIRIPIIDLTLN